MGWDCEGKKFKKMASLFPFTIPKKEKKYDILYLHYPSQPKREFYQSCCMNEGAGAITQHELADKFFKNLSDSTLKKILYRDYPKDYPHPFVTINNKSNSSNYLNKVNYISPSKFKGETSKEQIASSSLVIVNMLSTAYLESILMNVPTICLIDRKCLLLDKKYSDFFDDLIEAKIIHTNLDSSLKHFEAIHSNPVEWWNMSKTQNLKNQWIDRNFGDPRILRDYLLQLAKNN